MRRCSTRPRTLACLLLLAGTLALPPGARAVPATYRLRPSGESLWLHAPDGAPILDLRPELWLSLEPPQLRPLRRDPPRLERASLGAPRTERSRDGFAIRFEGGAMGGWYTIALRHRAKEPFLELVVEAHYRADRSVRAELLRFSLAPRGAEHAALLDRAYRLDSQSPPVLSDGLGPRVARLGPLALVAGEGVQTLWLRKRGEALELELELDHEANHPFRPHLRCVTSPTARVARGSLSATYRSAGSRASASARLLLGEPGLLLPGRFPRGYRAALVFTDHADQSSLAKLEALTFGETGTPRGERGLSGRGLGFTKTVFAGPARGYDPQLDDPGYRALLGELARAGVEIGLHSATGASDPPDRTRALLARFRAAGFTGRTWIDHQPTTNCEAVTAQGWDPSGRFHTLPLLAGHGFKLLWSAEDALLPAGSLNLLAPEPRGVRRPAIFRFASTPSAAALPGLRLFTTTRLFLPRGELARRLAPKSLERLERERGLCLAHTYLDTWRAGGKLSPRSLLEPRPRGRFRLRPEADALFAALAARQAAGGLWVAPLERVAAHLEAALSVELVPTAEGSYRLRAPGGRGVPGLTLIAPGIPRGAVLLVDGRRPPGARDRGSERELWFDLAGGRESVISMRDAGGRRLRFFQDAEIVLETATPRRDP